MTQTKKRIIYMISGLCAGLISYSVIELLNRTGISSFLLLYLIQGAFLGLAFGFVFGFSDGIFYKELKSGAFKALISAATGAAVAAGAQIITAQAILLTGNLTDIMLQIWRAIGWMITGAAIGAIDGIYKRSLKKTIAGLLGGLAGGLIGGLIYELMLTLIQLPLAGFIGLIIMGVLIGLFLNEFERIFSYGRLRIVNGALKDREYLLINRKTTIGQTLGSTIYLHEYKNIPSGRIINEDGEIYLETEGESTNVKNSAVTMLNDSPMDGRSCLKYHDVIQFGSAKLLYLPL